jgi:hypothetical protein
VHVAVSDIHLEDGKSDWETGYERISYIRWSPLRKLKKLVIDAEEENTRRKREGRELLVKYVTVVAAVLGAICLYSEFLITAGKNEIGRCTESFSSPDTSPISARAVL